MAFPFASEHSTTNAVNSGGMEFSRLANRHLRRARNAQRRNRSQFCHRPGPKKLLFEPLEPRLLLSADLPVAGPDAMLDGLELAEALTGAPSPVSAEGWSR